MALSGQTTLQELVYFGSVWQFLQENATEAPIPLGGGYHVDRIDRSADGVFFDGVTVKTNAAGRATDVVLTFSGALTADDFAQAGLIVAGAPSSQADMAVAAYQSVLNDPRFAGATVHVTGHSLGAGFTQYVLGYSLATYGKAFTDAHADFTQFGVPAFGDAVERKFGLTAADFDGRIAGYMAANDLTKLIGTGLVGEMNYLADWKPYPAALAPLNSQAAHMPFAYIDAIGLPAWLSAQQQAVIVAELQADVPVPAPLDTTYGAPGGVAVTLVGDGAANTLTGSSADDVLIGRGGQDVLTGGAGADLFLFERLSDSAADPAAADVVTDFNPGQGDRIDLSEIAPPGGLTFVGQNAFDAPGEVRFEVSEGRTLVEVEVTGGTAPTTTIALVGVIPLTASSFVLKSAATPPDVIHTGLFALPF